MGKGICWVLSFRGDDVEKKVKVLSGVSVKLLAYQCIVDG
jgi:hypothetical protein